MPDNVKRFETVDDRTFRLRLDRAYNPAWFTANQLGRERRPAAWAPRVEPRGTRQPPGKAFARLLRHAERLSVVRHRPAVEDRLRPLEDRTVAAPPARSRSSPTGSTPARTEPHLDRVVFKPFTTADSEIQRAALRRRRLRLHPAVRHGPGRRSSRTGATASSPGTAGRSPTSSYNFDHPTTGPMLRQLYVRQAVQHLIDQTRPRPGRLARHRRPR